MQAKTNYHGHTIHCKHGTGTIREHIESAIEGGLEEVAISEHVPIKGKRLSRIDYEDFASFMTELNELKHEYRGKIKVLTGLECEYVDEVFESHLALQQKYNIDFLCLGHHFTYLSQPAHHYFLTSDVTMASEYVKQAIAGIKSGHFKFIAHPDIFLNELEMTEELAGLSRELLQACEEHQLAVEINANGIRNQKGYPNYEFWQIAKDYHLQVIINSDAHAPSEVNDEAVAMAYQFAHDLGIEITERLEFS